MRPSENSPLPPEFRFHADLIACVVGILALPISGFFARNTQQSFPPGILFLLLVVAFASVAGVATVWRINTAGAKGSPVVPLVRAGARAGVLAALLAAAMLVLGERLFVSQIAALASALPAILSILPAGFFGMLVAASAAGVRMPKLPESVSEPDSQSRFLPITPLLVILSVAGFLSVFLPGDRVFVTSGAFTPPSSNPSGLSWRYEKPSELANAEAAQWEVAGTRLLPRSATKAPFAISPNGDSLAYLDFSKVLRVIDLNSDRFKVFTLGSPPRKLSFSPDGRRLIFESDAQPPGVGVIDLSSSNIAYLPRPSGNLIPDGDLVWFNPTQVLFQTDTTATKILDLDSLELVDPASSTTWSQLSEADRTRLSSAQRLALPTTAHCSFELRPQITWVATPNDQSGQEWKVTADSHLCIKDLAHAYRRFSHVNAAIDDRFIAAADGSKIIRIRGDDVLAIYFKTRPAPAVLFDLAMSKPADQYRDKDELSAAISSRNLCALVYGPLINPLNQKPIGPNRAYVKGLIRFSAWNGTQASAWLTEEFNPIQADDVVADLHVWKTNHAELISEPDTKGWWATIRIPSDAQHTVASLPADQNTKALDHTFAYYLAPEANALVVKNIDSQPTGEVASASATATPTETPRQIVAEQGRSLDPSESTYQMIAQFIAAHHIKANRGDLNGLVGDYADQVSYFKNGTVDRSFIFRDESISRAKFRTMSENIIYPLTIRELQPQRYRAHYQITYDGIGKKDNRRLSGTSDIYLLLETGPYGLRIVSQQSKL